MPENSEDLSKQYEVENNSKKWINNLQLANNVIIQPVTYNFG